MALLWQPSTISNCSICVDLVQAAVTTSRKKHESKYSPSDTREGLEAPTRLTDAGIDYSIIQLIMPPEFFENMIYCMSEVS